MKFSGTIVDAIDVRFDMCGMCHVLFDMKVETQIPTGGTALVACEMAGKHADDFAWQIHAFDLDGFRVAVRGAMTSARWRDHDGRQHVRSYFRVDELSCRLGDDIWTFGGEG